ncbi:MAG: hypothetical protein V1742_01840 [Pseudomonadota bacterium]
MIELTKIPLDLTSGRLAEQADVSEDRAAAFLNRVRPLLSPAAVFDETRPGDVWGNRGGEVLIDLGDEIIVGLCALGPGAAQARKTTDEEAGLIEALFRLALTDALDFLEYRLRKYLSPTGRRPGPRLSPGCAGLPLSLNQAILDYFGPEHDLGLTVLPSGEIREGSGAAFVYPAAENIFVPGEACRFCERKDCPGRHSN